MLWRVRITLPDTPGALAALTGQCGAAGVNILGLQVFPGIEAVTDELVLDAPPAWGTLEVADLIERSGATYVGGHRCTEAALVDQATRYVEAARTLVAAPARFPEVVASLFDAEPEGEERVGDVMRMAVGNVTVQVHRKAPFTATEHARGASLAALLSDVLAGRRGAEAVAPPGRRLGGGQSPELVLGSHSVTAVVDAAPVGQAVLAEHSTPGQRRLVLEVDPAWRRRGIGTRLFLEAARLANRLGDDEVVLVTEADNRAVLPLVMACGLRARIRMSGDVLTVRVPLLELARAGG